MSIDKTDEIVSIIHDNRDLIYKVCIMHAKNKAEIDDIFQEISIQLFKGYKTFNHQSKVSSWIYRVAINTSISWIRKEKRFGYKSNADITNTLYDDSPFYIENDKKEAIMSLYNAIEHLSEVDKTLVLLYLDEVSYEDISDILGITEVNVRVRMNRVRKKLKKLVSDEK